MANDFTKISDSENEKERKVQYITSRAHVTVHIPKRSPEEQEQYEKKVKAALTRFYYHVTSQGFDWDELTGKKNDMLG